jgi:short-subunit dehydrogenase
MPLALITGASSGIGATFAAVLAERGHDLVLVARSKDKLDALAAQLNQAHGHRVEVITLDLGEPGAAQRLMQTLKQRKLVVDLLINNAGFGSAGAFAKQDAGRDQQMVALNCAAVVDLAHAILPAMLERGSGGIINVASVAGFQPTPFMAVYGATKAFVLSFTESLWAEVQGKGVQITALCPGPVDTPFFEATGSPGLRKTVPKPLMMQARPVVETALAALAAGRPVAVPGLPSKLTVLVPRLLPRRAMSLLSARLLGR